jgi:DNA anti-recombination protein RmuC
MREFGAESRDIGEELRDIGAEVRKIGNGFEGHQSRVGGTLERIEGNQKGLRREVAVRKEEHHSQSERKWSWGKMNACRVERGANME